jgi:hypothetical protein
VRRPARTSWHETLGPDTGVEGLDERVVGWRSRPREVELHTVQIGPVVEQTSGELRAVVDPNDRVQDARKILPLNGPASRVRISACRRAPTPLTACDSMFEQKAPDPCCLGALFNGLAVLYGRYKIVNGSGNRSNRI